ncbi:hypothetical protein NM208_g2675 [Fusarium decemcellulare]|uniref:Uncharacterized protein n=1 Tax=Fusarium decemcellulare TaxID=57161 RepID=A0ACC1SS17_9HYPO|nr:hypothetical protein NM208_g2675 [Fusarium decemcellulare]
MKASEAQSTSGEQQPVDNPRSSARRSKRRARQACLSCRSRKVRCDVTQQTPCDNCKWHNLDCVVVGRRQRYLRVNNLILPHFRSSPEHNFEWETPGLPTRSCSRAPGDIKSSRPTPNAGTDPKQDLDDTSIEIPNIFDQDSQLLPDFYPSTPSLDSSSASPAHPSFPQCRGSKLFELPSCMTLPGYVKPLTTRIAVDDLAFLQSKGALTLPSQECRDELLWCFFEYVYPLMPILDIDEFLRIIENPDGKSGRISLLLLQAVLFAGSAFVKIDHLKDSGFLTRRQARKAMFQRVRLLYDFNAETDRLTLVQSLALMTLWYESSDEHRNTWHWTDVVISQCFAAGLHLDPSYSKAQEPPRIQRLRRRIWWTCFMRDRIVSMGMRRPPRIRDDDYNVLMLEQSDFQLQHKEGESFDEICSYASDTKKSSELAVLCISMTKLCCCLRHYVRTHHSIFCENSADGCNEVIRLPRYQDKSDFVQCNEDLLRWHEALPECCKHRPIDCERKSLVNSTIYLNRSLLDMIYFAAVASLHRFRFMSLLHSPEASLFDRELSKLCMQNAAFKISRIAAELHSKNLDISLPAMAITPLISAASIHLLELRGIIQADKQRTHEGFLNCMSVIESLKDMYAVANLAKDAMEWASVEPLGDDNVPRGYEGSSTEDGDSWNVTTKRPKLATTMCASSWTSPSHDDTLTTDTFDGTEGLDVMDDAMMRNLLDLPV